MEISPLKKFHSEMEIPKNSLDSSENISKKVPLYFFCPRCRKIPKIKIFKDTFIEIECLCKEKDDVVIENKYEHPDFMEMSKYSNYLITLDTFIKHIKEQKPLYRCCKRRKHLNDTLENSMATFYCSECCEWLCEKCLLDHNDIFYNHYYYNSYGMVLNYKCDEGNCRGQNRIKYYCLKCHKNFCETKGCEIKHKYHTFECIEIKTFFDKKDVQKIKADIELVKKEKEIYLNDLKNYLIKENLPQERIKEYIEKSEKEDNDLLLFFQSLLDTYLLAGEAIQNYFIKLNLEINDLSEIFYYRKAYIKSLAEREILEMNNSKDISYEPKVSYLTAIFNILPENVNKPILITGERFFFLNDSNCILKVDGKEYPYQKEFIFEKEGEHTIILEMKKGILLRNMFCIFDKCECLISIDLSTFDTSQVTSMRSCFYGCKALKKVNLKGLNTKYITSLKCFFVDCENLEEIDCSSIDSSNAENMEAMFYNCHSLKKLKIDSLNTSKAKSVSQMFNKCSSLTSIDLSNFYLPNARDISHMFRECSLMTSIDLSTFKTRKVKNFECLFYQSKGLETIKGLDSFDTSNAYWINHMFYECENLKSVDLRSFDTKKVISMQCIFYKCKALKTLDLSPLELYNLSGAYYMFAECISLISLDLSGLYTPKLSNTIHMFDSCESLEYLDISEMDFSNVIDIREMFRNCKNLKQLKMEGVNFSSVEFCKNLFEKTTNIQYIDLFNLNLSSARDLNELVIS